MLSFIIRAANFLRVYTQLSFGSGSTGGSIGGRTAQ